MENFGIFVNFRVNLSFGKLENHFIKDYWTTNPFLVDPFKHSNPPNLSKILQKTHENVQNLKVFGFFVIFGVQLRHFSL